MNIQDFYEKINGDFEDVMARMPMERLIIKYLLKFYDDQTFVSLQKALDQGDLEAAFRASHTLKGICSNLGLTALQEKCDVLTECLRKQDDREKAQMLFLDVKDEYHKVKKALELLKESQ